MFIFYFFLKKTTFNQCQLRNNALFYKWCIYLWLCKLFVVTAADMMWLQLCLGLFAFCLVRAKKLDPEISMNIVSIRFSIYQCDALIKYRLLHFLFIHRILYIHNLDIIIYYLRICPDQSQVLFFFKKGKCMEPNVPSLACDLHMTVLSRRDLSF